MFSVMSAPVLLRRLFTAATIAHGSFWGDTRSEDPISFSTPCPDVLEPVKPGDYIAVAYDESIADTQLATPRIYQVDRVEDAQDRLQRIHAVFAPAEGNG